jgi:predicted ATPase
MLRRLYIDNYKSLVNFDLELGRTHLLLGRNGSGKSAVFAVLSRLKSFLHEDADASALFSRATCTRWEKRTLQTFELEVELIAPTIYRYRLELEYAKGPPAVAHESLVLGDRPIFRREQDSAQMFHTNGTARPGELLVPARSSAIPYAASRHADVRPFHRWLGRSRTLTINPSLLQSASAEESSRLADDLANFASWYRHLAQEQPSTIRALEDDLRDVLGPEFQNMRLARTGLESDRELRVEWRVDAENADSKFELAFGELSEGQRALICLYALLHAASEGSTLLGIDEPDNFVALSEIQPWLGALSERSELQTLLISHHPELIDYAAENALYFYRRGQGPTRVKKFQELVHPEETLTAAELIARGWIDADS